MWRLGQRGWILWGGWAREAGYCGEKGVWRAYKILADRREPQGSQTFGEKDPLLNTPQTVGQS